MRSVFQNAKARLQEAKTSKVKDKERVKELQQASVPSKFEEKAYGLGLDFKQEPRLDRVRVNEIETHTEKQARESDKLWGWQDPSLTKRERMAANRHGGLEYIIKSFIFKTIAYDYGASERLL
jgi:hypothetical protein